MGFSKFAAQALKPGVTRDLVLNQLEGDPILVVQHLGETNKPFWSDAIARANVEENAGEGRKKLTPERIATARAKNRETIAKFAVVRLVDITDDDGRPATTDDIPAVINALPDDVFDTVVSFCRNPNNFRDGVQPDANAIAKK